jgi:NitT/TauT family transport system substrate-binding protein
MSRPTSHRSPWRLLAVLLALLAVLAAACGDDDDDDASTDSTVATEPVAATDAPGTDTTAAGDDTATTEAAADASEPAEPLEGTINLAFFPNVTHAPALVGVDQGLFQEALGAGVELNTFTFNAGTEEIEALFAGSIDIGYIGPNPAINGFAESGGEALRIIGGSTSGGAYLVVRPDITSPDLLEGTTLASPSLGNTQDVALRAWLAEQGFETTPEGGGDVTILPQSNSTTLESFLAGDIDGAWVPEPWATRLITEGGGSILVDERDLWPDTDGEYVTTHVIVRTEFLEEHPDLVQAFLVGHLDALDAIEADPEAAEASVNAQIEAITGSAVSPEITTASFANLTFTADPIAASLLGSAEDAEAIGLLDPVELDGIYDLASLNALLAERGDPEVSDT